jgi:hypothetical protein
MTLVNDNRGSDQRGGCFYMALAVFVSGLIFLAVLAYIGRMK